jgi:hypothetical protein
MVFASNNFITKNFIYKIGTYHIYFPCLPKPRSNFTNSKRITDIHITTQ